MNKGQLEYRESVSDLDIRIRAHIKYSSMQMETLLEEFLGQHPQYRRSLDIGCGSGNYSPLFARHHALYVGFDANTGLLAQAQDKCRQSGSDNVLFLKWDMNDSFPFMPESVDFAFSGFSAYYVDDAARLVEDCFDVLAPGGQVWFVGPALGNAFELDTLSAALFGVSASREKDIRVGRLQSEFHPAFTDVFGDCDLKERDFSLNFPDADEYATYYLATPQYQELAKQHGTMEREKVAETIRNDVGLKLTKKSVFLSAKK